MTTKSKSSKWLVGILIFCGIRVLLWPVFFRLIAWRIVDNEDEYLRRQLNNPYINAELNNWQSWEIPEIGSFCYPEDWKLNHSKTEGTLTSPDGRITGYGAALNTQDSTYSSITAFLGKQYNCSADEIYYLHNDPFGGIASIRGSHFSKWAAGERTLYVITLNKLSKDQSYKYFAMTFDSAQFESETEFRQLAEAVLFAFSFPKE